jgi:hypothetical protein
MSLESDIKELRRDLHEFQLTVSNWISAADQASKTKQSHANVIVYIITTAISLGALVIQWLDSH